MGFLLFLTFLISCSTDSSPAVLMQGGHGTKTACSIAITAHPLKLFYQLDSFKVRTENSNWKRRQIITIQIVLSIAMGFMRSGVIGTLGSVHFQNLRTRLLISFISALKTQQHETLSLESIFWFHTIECLSTIYRRDTSLKPTTYAILKTCYTIPFSDKPWI